MSSSSNAIQQLFQQFKEAPKGRREFRVECPNKPQLILNEVIQEELFLYTQEFFYFETADAQKEILSLEHSNNPSMDLIFSQIYPFTALSKNSPWQELISTKPLAPKILLTRDGDELYLEICEDSKDLKTLFEQTDPIEQLDWQVDQEFLEQEKKRYLNSFESADKALKDQELEKIVLARRLRLQTKISRELDWRAVAQQFLTKPGQSYRYMMKRGASIFVSLSPELLFTLSEEEIETQAIAGTCPRGETAQEDQKAFEKLLDDPKEKNEHEIVRREIEAGLNSLKLSSKWVKNHAPLKLAHVQHIYSKLSAEWSGQSLEDLVKALHPTPAVGGAPKNRALECIQEWEGFERGAYAAPIIINTSEKTYALVGLRSGFWDGQKLELYAGSGLVSGSTPEKEWEETQNKLKNFTAELR